MEREMHRVVATTQCIAAKRLRTYGEIGLYGDALLNQRSCAAVLRRHHDACRRLADTGHVVGHVEGARIIGDRAAATASAAGRPIANAAVAAAAVAGAAHA